MTCFSVLSLSELYDSSDEEITSKCIIYMSCFSEVKSSCSLLWFSTPFTKTKSGIINGRIMLFVISNFLVLSYLVLLFSCQCVFLFYVIYFVEIVDTVISFLRLLSVFLEETVNYCIGSVWFLFMIFLVIGIAHESCKIKAYSLLAVYSN